MPIRFRSVKNAVIKVATAEARPENHRYDPEIFTIAPSDPTVSAPRSFKSEEDRRAATISISAIMGAKERVLRKA